MPLFLLFRAERDDDRPDHRDAEAQRLWRRCQLQFLLKDVLLNRRPAGAAPLDRPVRDSPAFLVQDALPGDDVFLGQPSAFMELDPGALGQIILKKRPHLVAEGEFFGRKAKIHQSNSRVSRRPREKRGPRTTAHYYGPGYPLSRE